MKETDLLEVEMLGFSPANQPGGFVIFLKEKNHTRCLPIVVGAAEAQSISIILNPEPLERPMTYDTFGNIIDALCGEVIRVVVRKLERNTFYADIWLKNTTGDTFHLDARPSDAIALALKMGAPIFVMAEVLTAAGIEVPEELLNASVHSAQHSQIQKLSRKLNQAIADEDYEAAAHLRDQISTIRKELGEEESGENPDAPEAEEPDRAD